jgi:hypothetical protein
MRCLGAVEVSLDDKCWIGLLMVLDETMDDETLEGEIGWIAANDCGCIRNCSTMLSLHGAE